MVGYDTQEGIGGGGPHSHVNAQSKKNNDAFYVVYAAILCGLMRDRGGEANQWCRAMLGKIGEEQCWGRVSQNSVGEECCRAVGKSRAEQCWGRVL